MKLKDKNEMPFLWLLERKFPELVSPYNYAVFGDTIYGNKNIPDYLIAHESIHIKQQGTYWKGIKWWFKYWRDNNFRYQQELEAYRNQYKFHCKETRNKEVRSKYLTLMTDDLSGPFYKNIVSWEEARKQIREGITI